MKTCISLLAGIALLASSIAIADTNKPVNLNPDPNGTPWYANGVKMTPEDKAFIESLPELKIDKEQAPSADELPSSVDNSQHIYFRPIFAQKGASCAQASGFGYSFTYEMSLIRNLDAGLTENQYPEHFTWNHLNGGQGYGSSTTEGWNIAKENGIPDVITYGGMSTPSPYTKWMSGYDKYFQGMNNRVAGYYRIDPSTPEGIETLKHWLDNRGNGSDIGGLAIFFCHIGGNIETETLAYDSAHAGEIIYTRFGNENGHGMTFVGYDDNVKVDLNGDGQYTNDIDINNDGKVDVLDWEIGAIKFANSWGDGWRNSGFGWLSYSVLARSEHDGGLYSKAITLEVEPSFTPSMTLKVKMQHQSRSKISIKAGIASTEDAQTPEFEKRFTAFYFKGGDHPMQGDSSDPIEIGLDITSLTQQIGGLSNTKKLFLIIDEQDADNSASGQVISVSAIDYENGGIKYRKTRNVTIKNNTRTIIPVDLIEGPLCEDFTATNTAHETAGRAYSETVKQGETCWGTFCYGGTEVTTWYATGSDENLGTSGSTTTTLYTEDDSTYLSGSCPTPDITAPIISITGDNPLSVYQGYEFSDPGATATDDRDGDVTANITVTGSVNTNIIGEYLLTYTVSDAAGNTAEEIRFVNVVKAPACVEFTDTVANHETAGRAYSETKTEGQTCYGSFCWGGTTVTTWYANGSDENLGTNGSATITLIEQPIGSGVFSTGECPDEPQPPSIDSVNAEVTGSTVVISGTASDPDGDLQAIVLYFAGGGIECQGLENWTCPAMEGIQAGDYIAAVKAVDSTMLDSGLIEVPFTVEGPSIPTIDSYTYERHGTILSVSGEASDADGDIIEIRIHGEGIETATCSLSELPNFYCMVHDLTPGETYNLYLTAEDALGNTSAPIEAIELVLPESNPPVMETWNYEVTGNDLVVTGTSSDIDNDITSTVVYINSGIGVTCEGIEQWSCEVNNIPVGTHTFTIETSDSYSNDSTAIEFDVTIEASQAPSIDSYETNITGDTLTITGTASDPDGDLETIYYDNGRTYYTCTGTENFTCTITGLAIGDYSVELLAVDATGSESERVTVEYQYNGQAPTIDSYEYSTDGMTITFTGTASDVDGNLDRVVMTLGAVGGEICTGAETFTCTWTAHQAGTYPIGLAAYDAQDLIGTIPQIEITVSEQGECITDTNYNHVDAGRAYVGGLSNLYAFAVGSDDDLGLYGSTYYSTTTSLEETSTGVWTKVDSCP